MKENRNNNRSDDPLRNLVVSVTEVDRNRIARVLQNFLKINSKNGDIILEDNFNNLSINNKILAYLLGRKVSCMLEFLSTDIVDKDDLKRGTGIMRGILTPRLIDLKTECFISRSKTAGYYIGEDQVAGVLKELENEVSLVKYKVRNGYF